MKVLLTSNGFANGKLYDKFVKLVKENKYKRAVVITTAHSKKEEAVWARETLRQIKQIIPDTKFIDLEVDYPLPENVDVVYVCGGNTFRLLKFMHISNFKDYIKRILEKGGLYIGSSAGAVVASHNLLIAKEISPDKNRVGLKDFKALDLIGFHIVPHYDEDIKDKVEEFRDKYKERVIELEDGKFIYLDGLNMEIII